MQQLVLAINQEGWPLYLRRKADPAFLPLRDKIFARDRYACQFCGFQAKEYQDVVNLDGDYRHNRSSNLVTACCFCAQCFFVQEVGQGGFGGGHLIYLPEMSQVELNSFCHVIFCAMTNGTGYRETAQNIYRTLKFRSQLVEDKFGPGMGDPHVFGRALLEYESDQQKKVSETLLMNLRLLPSYARFKTQLERWAASAAEELVSNKAG